MTESFPGLKGFWSVFTSIVVQVVVVKKKKKVKKRE